MIDSPQPMDGSEVFVFINETELPIGPNYLKNSIGRLRIVSLPGAIRLPAPVATVETGNCDGSTFVEEGELR